MTKTYAVLQKKLQEVEQQVQQLPHNIIIHPSLSQEIHQKLLFVSNLLSAEVASCPTKPRHLKHIARRLAHLRTTFHDWGAENLLDHVDDSPTCSCTESCLNDDEEDGSGEFCECVEDGKEEKRELLMVKEESKFVGFGKLCGAMACGCLIGITLMGVAVFFIEFFGYLHDQQSGGFVTPT